MKGTSPSRASGGEAARHRRAMIVVRANINCLERAVEKAFIFTGTLPSKDQRGTHRKRFAAAAAQGYTLFGLSLSFSFTSASLSSRPTQTTTFDAPAPIATSRKMRSSISDNPPSTISIGWMTTCGATGRRRPLVSCFSASFNVASAETNWPMSSLAVVKGVCASTVASVPDSRCLTRNWFLFTLT